MYTYIRIYIYICCFMHLWSVLSDYVNSSGTYFYLTYYLEQQHINIPPSKISHPCWAPHPFVDEGRWYLWLATKRWGESNESQRVKIDKGKVASQRAKGLKFRETRFFKFVYQLLYTYNITSKYWCIIYIKISPKKISTSFPSPTHKEIHQPPQPPSNPHLL